MNEWYKINRKKDFNRSKHEKKLISNLNKFEKKSAQSQILISHCGDHILILKQDCK